jgi:eukaryotic-like serine/threonine-protein kinase
MTISCPTCFSDNLDQAVTCTSCGEQLVDTYSGNHLPAGTSLNKGRYKIEKTLGEGGFGITYKGCDLTKGNIEVAIKELWPEKGSRNNGNSINWPLWMSPQNKREQIESFQKEAQNIAKCIHPSIVKVFDYFIENNTAYIVMEFIKGKPLSEVQKESGGKISEFFIKKYFLHVAEALRIVHGADLLHRDIKPDNIMINSQDRAVLIDFGNAREYIANVSINHTRNLTPGYAPLEQYSQTGKRGPSTDFYAVCASMYDLLVGCPPPEPVNTLNGTPLIPPRQLLSSVDSELDQIIMSGLKLQPEDRFQTADELINALKGRFTSPSLKKAQELVRQARLTDAVAAYKSCLAAEPHNSLAAVEIALVLLHTNDQQVEAAAKLAVQIAPEDGRGQGVLGLLACRQGNWSIALQHLQEAVNYAPQINWLQANLAWAEAKTGNWPTAYQRAKALQKALPTDAFVGFLVTWIAANQKNWRVAIAHAKLAFNRSRFNNSAEDKLHQDCVYSCLLLSADNLFCDHRNSETNNYLQQFLMTIPDSIFAQGFKGYRQAQFLRWSAAESSLARLPQPSQWILINLAASQEQQGKLNEAFATYEKIYNLFGKSAYPLFRMGTIMAQKSDWPKAQEYLEKALELDKSLPEAQHNLGWVIFHIKTADGQVEQARQMIAAYQTAIELYSNQGRTTEVQQIQNAFAAIGINI